jgi:hypothetical protein
MGEISDLVRIYGDVDMTVAGDDERRAPVARLLPEYEHDDVHWFETFAAWTIERRRDQSDRPPFPPLDEALRDLAETPARGRMRARRLMAIAVAVQAFPEMGDPESELGALAAAALGAEGLTDDPGNGAELLRLLADDDLLLLADDVDADRWWAELLERAAGLIGDAASMGPRPCTGQLVLVEVAGQTVPVTTLATEFEVDLDFARAVAFLDPVNWPGCSAFWCEMQPAGVPGVNRYREKVSTDCAHEELAWTIRAVLDFAFAHDPGFAAAEYRMSPGVAQHDVLVDEGSLVVEQLAPGRLAVSTTKRVLFDGPLSGRALAMLMCVLGYAYVVEDLIFTCAMSGAEGTLLPENAGESECGPAITALADDAAAAITACLEDWADAAQASSKKIAEGRYTADALAQDLAGMWSRTLRHGAAAIDLGARGTRNAATGRRTARRRPAS